MSTKLSKITKPLLKIAKQVSAYKDELLAEKTSNAKAAQALIDRDIAIAAELSEVDAVLETDIFQAVTTKK